MHAYYNLHGYKMQEERLGSGERNMLHGDTPDIYKGENSFD